MSAKTGEGVSELLSLIEMLVEDSFVQEAFLFPYSSNKELSMMRDVGVLMREEFLQEGTFLVVKVAKVHAD